MKVFIMKKKIKSTYDQITSDPKRKKRVEKQYQSLIISELIIAAMNKDTASVRELAKEAGVSPTIIQELKMGRRTNITLSTFNKVLNAIGYQITFEPLKTTCNDN